jgi:hypothetical protein
VPVDSRVELLRPVFTPFSKFLISHFWCSVALISCWPGRAGKACKSPIGAVQTLGGTFKCHPLSPFQKLQLWNVLAVNPTFGSLLIPILAATERERGVPEYHVIYLVTKSSLGVNWSLDEFFDRLLLEFMLKYGLSYLTLAFATLESHIILFNCPWPNRDERD